MFGIGFSELVLIFVVALLVLGPKRLPEVAKTLGKFYREIRSTVDEVKEVVIEEPKPYNPSEKTRKPEEIEAQLEEEIETEIEYKEPKREKISFKKKNEENQINDSGNKES